MAELSHSQSTIVSPEWSQRPEVKSGGTSCLVRIHPPDAPAGLIVLPLRRFIIGRTPECDLELVDAAISRHHAFIEPREGRFTLVDEGSTNGTFVNDQRIKERFLIDGDLVRVGSHIVKFLSSDNIEARYHETIHLMAITDGLTGIHNARCFRETLDREVVRSQRHRRPLSLVMFDIDHFKRINDAHGHPFGDAVLRELCGRVQTTIRNDELFARCGGEEFGVILPETVVDGAVVCANRIRSFVGDKPFQVDSLRINVTISLGVAHTSGERPITSQGLVDEADAKLYQAKRAGRNRVHF